MELHSLRNLSVLVVDDNATNRRILQEILTNWRMKPTLAEGGPDALAAMKSASAAGKPFHLALIDGHMPSMDGFTLAERLRRDRRLAKTTLIMLTSAGQPGDAARCRQVGVRAYLTKPIKQSDLFDAIVTALPGTAAKRTRASLVAGDPVRGSPRRLRILLAEDNIVNQKLAMRLLQKRGHRVAVAGNGREALAALEKQSFDVVLMDVQMPEMGGFEATAAIREKEQGTGERLPIVAMTAHAMKGDRERCLRAGMDAYIPKPIQPEELFKAIEQLARPPAETSPALRPTKETEEAFDKDALLARFDGDVKLLRQLIRLFVADCPKMLLKIKRAIAKRDASTLASAAHTLKGSVGNFTAGKTYAAALNLEMMGRGGDLAAAGDAFLTVKTELACLNLGLSAFAKRRSSKTKDHPKRPPGGRRGIGKRIDR